MKNSTPKFIFITGGVVSSLGKGLASASLASLFISRGFKVRLRKLDPYLNVDPGTMSPYQHGECFVTDDGAETDLDLGHYERFTGVNSRKSDNVTTGKIYSQVLKKERRGDYLGATIQVIPHVTDAIKKFIISDISDEDFMFCEIGGTVGDIESLPFIEAIRQLRNELGKENTCFVHVTLLPFINAAKELKTKPTQHSVKELQGMGIQPDILLCRTEMNIPEDQKKKIAQFCNVKEQAVIEAIDVNSIYEVPIAYNDAGFDKEILDYFNLYDDKSPDLSVWKKIISIQKSSEGEVNIGIVGKYTSIIDSYKSLIEAITHGGIAKKTKINFVWIDSQNIDSDYKKLENLSNELWDKYSYKEEEEDRVVLNVSLKASQKSNVKFERSYLLDAWGDKKYTAMARLVSIPVALAVEAILKNKISIGVSPAPKSSEIVSNWLDEIKKEAQIF